MECSDCAVGAVLAAKEEQMNQRIAFAVAAKQLEAARAQGAAAVQLVEAAVRPANGPGQGGNVDTYA